MESTKKMTKIETIRHSFSHVLAQAILDMFPEAKLGIGPPIENGFYYDFELPRTLIPEDLKILEKKMKNIIKQNQAFVNKPEPVDKAIEFLKLTDQNYKVELAQELKEGGEKEIGFYENVRHNDKKAMFVDMCRGPHVESTKDLNPKAFKLDKIAGAYWKGDSERPMMQRIYGLAFEEKEELDEYVRMMEEAKKRDHKVVGRKMGLFTFSELVGPGLPLWTPKGTLMRNLLDDYVWELRKSYGYTKVTIPHLAKKDLYETSGHWTKFSDDLFKVSTREGHEFVIKPMNCPHHTQIFDSEKRSYKDMPQRYAETTMVYRDEQTGELAGLSRVRSITQDDAHVFCREGQVKEEAFKIWDIIETFYGSFGFDLRIRLSIHDPEQMDKYMGSLEKWESSVQQFRDWFKERDVEYFDGVGEAAFYGPKIDFITKDSIGRDWQIATIQVDRSMPESFDLSCVNEEGEDERIVMIHAAIMGSIERFTSILIEHFAGAFPTWLAPKQFAILPVADVHLDYAQTVKEQLEEMGGRVLFMSHEDSLGKRIRNAELEKIPYILVVGDKEQDKEEVAVRSFRTKEQKSMKFKKFLKTMQEEIAERKLEPFL